MNKAARFCAQLLFSGSTIAGFLYDSSLMEDRLRGRANWYGRVACRVDSYMKSKPNVWFATAEQIARYVRAEAELD